MLKQFLKILKSDYQIYNVFSFSFCSCRNSIVLFRFQST